MIRFNVLKQTLSENVFKYKYKTFVIPQSIFLAIMPLNSNNEISVVDRLIDDQVIKYQGQG